MTPTAKAGSSSADAVGFALVRYDAMCTAIAECHQVDEVKDLHDKAKALQEYHRQANNPEAERMACEVRLRAARRVGELLADLARATPQERGGNHGNQHKAAERPSSGQTPVSPYAKALADTGMSRQKANNFQKLAEVDFDVFEQHLRDPDKRPSTAVLIQRVLDPVPQMPAVSLWIWGRMRDFERDRMPDTPAREILDSMTESMRADMRRILPRVIAFLTKLEQEVNNHELA